MRLVKALAAVACLTSETSFNPIFDGADAFNPSTVLSLPHRQHLQNQSIALKTKGISPNQLCRLRLSTGNIDEADCGCAVPTSFSGNPSTIARDSTNHRTAIAKLPLFKVDGSGSSTNLDEIIGDPDRQESKTSLVVFLRSLG